MHIFNRVSIREEKRWQERRMRRAAAAHSAQHCDKKQSPYENNNAVTCKQDKNMSPHPTPPPPAHSLGKRATKEMRSAKFLITEAAQE